MVLIGDSCFDQVVSLLVYLLDSRWHGDLLCSVSLQKQCMKPRTRSVDIPLCVFGVQINYRYALASALSITASGKHPIVVDVPPLLSCTLPHKPYIKSLPFQVQVRLTCVTSCLYFLILNKLITLNHDSVGETPFHTSRLFSLCQTETVCRINTGSCTMIHPMFGMFDKLPSVLCNRFCCAAGCQGYKQECQGEER